VLAVLIGVIAALSACGGGDSSRESASGSGNPSGEKKYNLAYVTGLTNNEFFIPTQCGAEAEARKLGQHLIVQGPDQYDPAKQLAVLSAIQAKNPDGIVISAVSETALAAPLKAYVAKGHKVVLLGNNVAGGEQFASALVSSDDVEGGRIGARTLSTAIGGKGKVLAISAVKGSAAIDRRVQGFEEVIRSQPGVDYLGVQYSNTDPVKAAAIVAGVLAKNPDLAGIFTTNQVDSQGIGTALQRARKVGSVKFVAFDTSTAQVKQLKAGVAQALVGQTADEMGSVSVRALVDALDGKKVKYRQTTPLKVLTKSNVDDPANKKFLYRTTC
jgi:ribose transport system substrate-binding protein